MLLELLEKPEPPKPALWAMSPAVMFGALLVTAVLPPSNMYSAKVVWALRLPAAASDTAEVNPTAKAFQRRSAAFNQKRVGKFISLISNESKSETGCVGAKRRGPGRPRNT